ncbi:hypothetical protein PP101_10 [Pectobacterium phage PP101]|uniref:Uncharacterized protein n=1 Tax=Pectobacterium phage PP101 TaxID=1916414 RepID=A0A1J0MFL2_9CAUD|nr:hypothetical protein HOR42_gp10 [Pectobacterium phage PP101]APD19738.1 hypothetical protein PP101_10 [Pectobacterium phage PP101]
MMFLYVVLAVVSSIFFAYQMVPEKQYFAHFSKEVYVLLGVLLGTVWPVSWLFFLVWWLSGWIADYLKEVKYKK